jgi:hypothetical protein
MPLYKDWVSDDRRQMGKWRWVGEAIYTLAIGRCRGRYLQISVALAVGRRTISEYAVTHAQNERRFKPKCAVAADA